MAKKKISFYLIYLFLIHTRIIYAKKFFTVSAPAYPVTVTAEDQKTASEIIFFCGLYFTYLKEIWGISPTKIKPVNIIIETPFKKGSNPYIENSYSSIKFYTDITRKSFKKNLCVFFADHFIKSNLTVNKKTQPSVPQCIAVGISGVFLKEKINPSFTKAQKSLLKGSIIPFNKFLTGSYDIYKKNDKIFTLQSIYFVNFLLTNNYGKSIFIEFLQNFAVSSDSAINFLLKTFHANSINELENQFLKKMIQKLKVYNIVSTQTEYSKESILYLLDEILVFQYKHNGSNYVSVKASDIKVSDMPFINKERIFQKIIQLNVLISSSPDNFRSMLTEYIQSLKYLSKGEFNNYFDSFYKASFLKDLLKRKKQLCPQKNL